MDLFQFLLASDICDNWGRSPGATIEEVTHLSEGCRFALPSDYLNFLLFSNGTDAPLPILPYGCNLFSAEEVLEANQDYELEKYLPGYFAIGTSGGGELLVFDYSAIPWRVCSVPAIGLSEANVLVVAQSFLDLLHLIGRDE